jgi:hypothetical protein
MRLGIVSVSPGVSDGGLEFAVSWFNHEIGSDNQQTGVARAFDINILTQRRFRNYRTALNFRLGTGFFFPPDDPNEGATSGNQLSVNVSMGLSLFWPIKNHLYLETGIDCTYMIAEDAGYLRPWIGMGFRF